MALTSIEKALLFQLIKLNFVICTKTLLYVQNKYESLTFIYQSINVYSSTNFYLSTFYFCLFHLDNRDY